MFLSLQSKTPDSSSTVTPSAPAGSRPHPTSMDLCALEMSCGWTQVWPSYCFPWRSGDAPSLRSSLWLSTESPCASATSVCPSLCVCADRHSGCCHVLAVLILRAHAFICAPVSSSLGEYLPVEWWGRTGILVSPRGPAAVFVSAAKPLCSPASSR